MLFLEKGVKYELQGVLIWTKESAGNRIYIRPISKE